MDKKRKADEKRELRKQRRLGKKESGGAQAEFRVTTVDEFGNVIDPDAPTVEPEFSEESSGSEEGELVEGESAQDE